MPKIRIRKAKSNIKLPTWVISLVTATLNMANNVAVAVVDPFVAICFDGTNTLWF